MGEHYIKLSTTYILNRIRKEEEFEKGWKKNEIRLPAELRDLNPVHVVPLKKVVNIIFLAVKITQDFDQIFFSQPKID